MSERFDPQETRRRQLEGLLREQLDLRQEIETRLAVVGDPMERRRLTLDAEQARHRYDTLRAEYDSLGSQTAASSGQNAGDRTVPRKPGEEAERKFDGRQIKPLQEALLSAFPTSGSLERMVRTELGENLAVIAGGANLAEIIFHLIVWAEAQGRLDELVRGAATANPGNPALQRLLAQHPRPPEV